MSDCKRQCSLFIYEKCSVILQAESLVANPCGLYPFYRAANYPPKQASITSFSYEYTFKNVSTFSGSTRFVPV